MSPLIILPVDGPAPIGPACAGTQRVANTFWTNLTPTELSWNGTSWDLFVTGAVPEHRLAVLGTWNLGYRPTSIDFVFTIGHIGAFDYWEFKVSDTAGNIIGNVGGAFQGLGLGQHTLNCPLTFVEPNDIGNGGPAGGGPAGWAVEFQGDSYTSGLSTLDGICFLPS